MAAPASIHQTPSQQRVMQRITFQQPGRGQRSCDNDPSNLTCWRAFMPCSCTCRHDWKICPYAHPGEVARRRHPRGYTAVLCPAKTAVSPRLFVNGTQYMCCADAAAAALASCPSYARMCAPLNIPVSMTPHYVPHHSLSLQASCPRREQCTFAHNPCE